MPVEKSILPSIRISDSEEMPMTDKELGTDVSTDENGETPGIPHDIVRQQLRTREMSTRAVSDATLMEAGDKYGASCEGC